MPRILPLLIALALLAGCGAEERAAGPALPPEAGGAESFALERAAAGLVRPTWAGAAPGDLAGLWVAEQPGRLVRLARGKRRVVLDLRRDVRLGAEQGLLGVAFHPDFARTRELVLHYSDRRGDTRVAAWRTGTPWRKRRELLFVDQPEENHNGGAVVFGPDGDLYLGLGDGGGAFDPQERAQDLRSRLGKLLAADIDTAGRPRWRIVAYGLRNPWRFSFDPALGEVWIGDVGQDDLEEVHRAYLEPDEPPKNFGWSAYDGPNPIEEHRLDETGQLVWPVAGYSHAHGCSITGGAVYRGSGLPRLSGRYLYGDFCTGTLWTLRPTPQGGATDIRREAVRVPQLTHLGTDARGEPLLVSGDGTIWRAVPPRAGRR